MDGWVLVIGYFPWLTVSIHDKLILRVVFYDNYVCVFGGSVEINPEPLREPVVLQPPATITSVMSETNKELFIFISESFHSVCLFSV
ncbi:MAG: hypothetical protein A3C06_01445 [Candidatus Taylorbacteria bacterium RIFCSPHIGHO2_02_FULL_46_13]|uniref:Uncharacterized protein n=1 Tax=Candidatus Taylorbacteria bacterium RIFCSPHIGHO2_02_FULL_46_13 TaxID=1802312 RepID=A0A1G2MSC6_9BACT|nr:MAG: hypothetical protein A3C06_01445 [Candidatus Taylorbacteria bacterium RIFCSPHIGHO2_02_FULL_46_13]